MIDNSTDPSTDKLVSQATPATSTQMPSPVATPPIVTPAVIDHDVAPPASDTPGPIATPSVNPSVQEAPQRDAVIDPSIVALRAMFPDYDDLILISVLESVGGSQDRAIDALLGMSDPEYKGEPPTGAQPEQPALSQTELDEQFARHLMIEEEQQRQQQWVNANQRPPVTYQSHSSQRRWNSQAKPDEGGVVAGNSTGDLQEQFNKIAESGKKTFGNLFSKVKAKIHEFDQSRSTGQTSGSSARPPRDPNITAYSAQGQAQPASVTQPSYYDPNYHSMPSAPIITQQRPPAATPAPKGYDLSPSSSPAPPETHELPPEMNSPAPHSSLSGPIEAGKFGLLPKRPVSLLRDPAATASSSPPAAPVHLQQTTQLSDDDDDGLEYTENPFEEAKKQ